MSAEHPPVPAERARRSQPAKAETVKDLAEAIAGQIAAQQEPGANISGNFTVDIVYQNVEYRLTVVAPESETLDEGFWIANGERTDLATDRTYKFLDLAFKNADNWKVGVGLPMPVTFTNGEIKELRGEFQMGTVPPPDGDRRVVEA